MSFFKNWARKAMGSLSGDSKSPDPEDDEEALDWSARLVHVPVRGAARVWKTQAVAATPDAIFLLPPNTEWESTLPADEPVTVVFTRPGEMAEFESVATRAPHSRGMRLSVSRPENLEWKKAETPVNQNRKFLRVEVSLPAELSLLEPSVSGRARQVGAPHRCRVEDLSIEGMSVGLDFEAPSGRLCDIRVLSTAFSLQVQAKIIRAKPSGDHVFPFTAAVAFENLNPVTRDMIGQFILSRQRDSGG